MVFSTCTNHNNDNGIGDELINPQENVDMWLEFGNNAQAYPFDLVTITTNLGELSTYTGTIGDIEITAHRQKDETFAFAVPFIKGGRQKIILYIGDKRAEGELYVNSYAEVENPQEIINEMTTVISNMEADLEHELSSEGQTLNTDVRQLLGEFSAEYNRLMTELTDAEKIYLAEYWNAHPELLNSFTGNDDTALRTSVFDKLKSAESRFVRKIMACGILIGAVGVATVAPDASISKAVAIISGATLITVLIKAGKELNTLFETKIFPDEIIPSVTGGLRSASSLRSGEYDYTFYWGVPVTFSNFRVSYRTLYAADSVSGGTIGKIVSNISTFHEYWDMVDGKVSKIKSFFGFRGGLGNRPKKLEQVTTYKTGDIEIVQPTRVDIGREVAKSGIVEGHFISNPYVFYSQPYTRKPPFDVLLSDNSDSDWTKYYNISTPKWGNGNGRGTFHITLYFGNNYGTIYNDDSDIVVFDYRYTSNIIGKFVEIHTPTAGNITEQSVKLDGNVTILYPYAEIVERGFYCGDVKISCGNGAGTFSYNVNNLSCGNIYRYSAYAIIRHTITGEETIINSDGESYVTMLNCPEEE